MMRSLVGDLDQILYTVMCPDGNGFHRILVGLGLGVAQKILKGIWIRSIESSEV
jgi:hypothetical protein